MDSLGLLPCYNLKPDKVPAWIRRGARSPLLTEELVIGTGKPLGTVESVFSNAAFAVWTTLEGRPRAQEYWPIQTEPDEFLKRNTKLVSGPRGRWVVGNEYQQNTLH